MSSTTPSRAEVSTYTNLGTKGSIILRIHNISDTALLIRSIDIPKGFVMKATGISGNTDEGVGNSASIPAYVSPGLAYNIQLEPTADSAASDACVTITANIVGTYIKIPITK